MNAFLSHAPSSWDDCHPSEEASVAEVDCADAVPTAGISNGLSVCLGCPVFKRDFEDDRTGNLWPIERLTPRKLAAVPHCSHPDNLVVLSCFASFMHQIPEVSRATMFSFCNCLCTTIVEYEVPVTAIAMFAANFRFSLQVASEIA